MKTELVTFAVKPGLEAEAETWMDMLRARRLECVATLERERMRYESVFVSHREGRMYLTWFSVQAEGGSDLADSRFEVDRLHLEFWDRCIDPAVPPVVFEHVVSFAPEDVAEAVRGGG